MGTWGKYLHAMIILWKSKGGSCKSGERLIPVNLLSTQSLTLALLFHLVFLNSKFHRGLQSWYVGHQLYPLRVILCCKWFYWIINTVPFLQLFVVISCLLISLLPWIWGLICFHFMYYNFNEVSGELRKRHLCFKWQQHRLFFLKISTLYYLRRYVIEKYFYIQTTKPTLIWGVMTNLKEIMWFTMKQS